MKRFILAILFIAAFGFSATPNIALARRHHVVHRYYRRRYVVHYRYIRGRRVVYRTVRSRSHGINANTNVGVGLGPIHIGVGAGGGIQIHAFAPPRTDPPNDPPTSMNSTSPRVDPQVSANGQVIVHPTDCDLECYVNPVTPAVAYCTSCTASGTQKVDVRRVEQRFALSPDTNVNDYYVNYVPPRVVSVDGFSVAVTGNPAYYSPFKHGRAGFWYVHNRKGVDPTAGYGVSPRAGPIPESIGGTAYVVTTVEE